MKFLFTIFLLLISTPSTASAQQIQKQASNTSDRHTSLTRAQIREAEQKLSDTGYWTGAVDGLFDSGTRSALIAFQKWEGRAISSRLTVAELEAIRASASPRAREPGYAHVEVDLDRQVLLMVNDNDGVRVLPISSGSGREFKDEGQTSIAYTPRGRFVVYDKTVGWERPPFQSMYYPSYISGGVAIHGYRSVPTQPASHGCIRIPIFAARELSKLMKLGTIVLVYDQVSFVSARSWADDPQLRQAALLNSRSADYTYGSEGTKTKSRTKTKPRSLVIKKARSKIIRAGS